ncbi:hypothetical protein ACLBWX_07265 [Methylobacterium sp. M6A4_1b]
MNNFFKSLAIYALAGPLIGSLVYFCVRSFIEWDPNIFQINLYMIIVVSYGIGIIPALLSGFLYQYLAFFIKSKIVRVLTAIPIGAAAMFTWISETSGYVVLFDKSVSLSVLFGSFVSFVCAGIIEFSTPSARIAERP